MGLNAALRSTNMQSATYSCFNKKTVTIVALIQLLLQPSSKLLDAACELVSSLNNKLQVVAVYFVSRIE